MRHPTPPRPREDDPPPQGEAGRGGPPLKPPPLGGLAPDLLDELAPRALERRLALDVELPGIIRRFNESVGGVNSDTEGYHETITRCFLDGVRLFLKEAETGASLHENVNELLLSPMGRRDWPLRSYSRERLFSVG